MAVLAGTPAKAEPLPPWTQAGITSVGVARDFLATLRSRNTLLFPSSDGDIGYPLTARRAPFRGLSVSVCPNVIAGSAPPADLLAYQHALGFGSKRVYHPAATATVTRLATQVLDEPRLVEAIRADRSLTRAVVAFKDRSAAMLLDRLGLEPAYCAPRPEVYEAANDKLRFAHAGPAYGFETLAVEPADPRSLDRSFRTLAQHFDDGCIVRLSRGAAGYDIHHARSAAAARRIWRHLAPRGQVVMMPFVPSRHVVRNVATHGIVTADGFAPLVFSEQRLHGTHFRGGRVALDWTAEEIAVISASLERIARWLRDLGYVNAPAGIDGFLVREAGKLRFLALDPNIRMTGTMLPWAAVATLAEAANRRFVWQAEQFYMRGVALSFAWLARRLGADLVDPADLQRGGILPSWLGPSPFGRIGASGLGVIVIGRDAEHLGYLLARIRRLALIVR